MGGRRQRIAPSTNNYYAFGARFFEHFTSILIRSLFPPSMPVHPSRYQTPLFATPFTYYIVRKLMYWLICCFCCFVSILASLAVAWCMLADFSCVQHASAHPLVLLSRPAYHDMLHNKSCVTSANTYTTNSYGL